MIDPGVGGRGEGWCLAPACCRVLADIGNAADIGHAFYRSRRCDHQRDGFVIPVTESRGHLGQSLVNAGGETPHDNVDGERPLSRAGSSPPAAYSLSAISNQVRRYLDKVSITNAVAKPGEGQASLMHRQRALCASEITEFAHRLNNDLFLDGDKTWRAFHIPDGLLRFGI